MKRFLTLLIFLIGGILAVATYERLFVERTVGPSAILALALLAALFLILLATRLLYPTRFRPLVGNAWLVIASLGLSYAAVDVIAGLVLIEPLSPPLVPDQYRHHRLEPDTRSEFQQRDFHYIQRVNNLGLRGPDRPARKPADVYRVLMLGDSFTMGKGVNDDETFSARLEVLLQKRLAGCAGRRPEVLNGGVDSYTPILSYLQLTRDLHALEPDLVVLNLDVSDLVQEAAYRELAQFDTDGAPVAVPQPAPAKASLNERVRIWAERHLYLTRLLMYHVNRLFRYRDVSVREVVTHANYEVAAHTLAGDRTPRDQQWRDVFDSILRIRAFAASRGMDFVLSAYPWGHQVNDTEWQPGRRSFVPEGAVASDASLQRVAAFADANGIRFADLFPVFRAYTGGDALYFRHDNHWTPAGHEVMARGLADMLDATVRPRACL